MDGVINLLITILTPFVLNVLGPGLASLAISAGWSWLFWTGHIIAGVGLLWGVVLLLLHGPIDLLP